MPGNGFQALFLFPKKIGRQLFLLLFKAADFISPCRGGQQPWLSLAIRVKVQVGLTSGQKHFVAEGGVLPILVNDNGMVLEDGNCGIICYHKDNGA